MEVLNATISEMRQELNIKFSTRKTWQKTE